MSLTSAAASGAIWSIGAGVFARLIGLVGTLVITHHLEPALMGEVAAASALAFTASWMSGWGFNQYVVVKAADTEDGLFHASVLHVTTGLVALSVVALLTGHFAEYFNAPGLGSYLPGMVLVVAIRRLTSIPNKLLIRAMRFKRVAIAAGAGELVYVGLAVGLVVSTDLGGQAIVIANIVQALIVASIEISGIDVRGWLTPKPWNWGRVREILQFGAPIGVETLLSEASRSWDKLMFSRLFGTHDTGTYSLAYNLSDLPATYVGEHVATVLFPTMAQIAPERRYRVFVEASGLLAMVVMPMALGLASVAGPLVRLLLSAEWQGVADFLVVLAFMAIFRPLNAVFGALLIATERSWLLLTVEVLRVSVLFGGMWYLSRFGEMAAAAAVTLALALQLVVTVGALSRQGFPAGEFLAVRRFLADSSSAPLIVQIAAEIGLGVVVYLGGLLVFARSKLVRFAEIMSRQLEKRGV
jgi:O-antigen/teichoic acid export membrane protein